MAASPLVVTLLGVWASITLALVLVLIYRSIVSMKREGQLFLNPGEAHLEAEQTEILKKLDRLAPIIRWLIVLSIALIVAISAIWVYQGLTSGPSTT